ncbi:MAG TPA: DUF1254 domain-containing protein [Candidatus Sulfotelmatobacter sp.]|nr:DUF1254 domain-containing protein [Candidatus Sulfotelmatobacter sp.]
MRRSLFLAGSAAALAATGGAAGAAPGDDLTEAAIRAYVFAYPLVLVALTERHQLTATAPNQFRHDRALATPANRFIVRPNVDTLYSSAFLDLRNGPVLLTIPASAGHFYVCEVMDAWTNVFADPGTRTGGGAAQQLVFARPGQHVALRGVRRVDAPTDACWIFNRIALHAGADLAAVHALQDGFTLRPLAGGNAAPGVSHAASDPVKLGDLVAAMSAQAFFSLAAARLVGNPPPSGDGAGLRDLAQLGIEPGGPVQMAALSPSAQAALQSAPAAALREITTLDVRSLPLTATFWLRSDPRTANFGADDLLRARVAAYGIAANLPADALYYATRSQGRRRLRFAPGALPPQRGFWSLTMYDTDGYLVPNALDRYALRDGDPLVADADGGLTLELGADPPADAARRANWLPAPAGPYTLLLRLYWPDPAALNGSWIPPALT